MHSAFVHLFPNTCQIMIFLIYKYFMFNEKKNIIVIISISFLIFTYF